MNDITIRTALLKDAQKLLEIYTPYVEKTAITFEYEVPTLTDFQQRICHTLEKYPYLVAQRDGEILGYSYAGPFKARPAYDWAVETTVYIRQDQKKTGLGRKLYKTLEAVLLKQNIQNLYACIAYTEAEDSYLTQDSVHFHKRLGYRLIGQFKQCGYKFDRWYDMVWMEKHLGNHEANPPAVIPFSEYRELSAVSGQGNTD